jgi:hypothetical protein
MPDDDEPEEEAASAAEVVVDLVADVVINEPASSLEMAMLLGAIVFRYFKSVC